MTSDVITEALGWLAGVSKEAPSRFRIDADPHPESLRVARTGRVYKGKLYAEFLQQCVKQLAVQRPAQPLEGDLIAIVEVVVTRPAKTVKVRPSGDFDNLAKGPSDALTQAGIWADDDNVVSAVVHKRWAAPGELAGVNITVGSI